MGAIKRNIPNFITCLNLVCGCLGILLLFNGMPIEASCLMFLAAFLDLFDGLIARALKVSSPIGKDLDSLADVISFGVLPGFITLNLVMAIHKLDFLIASICLIIPVFSAIRLAIFNNDQGQSNMFKGLATPANALFWGCVNICFFNSYETFTSSSWIIISQTDLHRDFVQVLRPVPKPGASWLAVFIYNYPVVLVIAVVLLSVLMVSPVKLIAFKFKSFGWKENKWRYLLLILCLPLVIFLGFASAPIILILYIIISQIHFRTQHEIQS